jgi:hypothetical protein
MEFVDLDRLFIPLKRDAEPTLEWGPNWGQKYGGWLDWNTLLAHWRVVLLAEALSGKTKEFQNRVPVLREAGKLAFFASIEDLADARFESALDDVQRDAFRSWKQAGAGEAWFFLDSVDEARLNNKKLAAALQTFRDAVSTANLNRAHIVVSCRVSDWRGKADRDSLQNELPYAAPTEAAAATDPDEILLSPVFDRTSKEKRPKPGKPEPDPTKLVVVQLAPLTREQQQRMAEEAAIPNVQAFLTAVRLSGLESLCERPGDLIGLIEHWLEHGEFGSLQKMTEEGIKRKLREEDAFRPDGALLSPEQARRGAERLAAALVLAKTFTIKAPAQEADPSLARGAIDSRDVLGDWDQAAINALLRTGLFAPGTYGRVRFHHRSTQEYLAACWLRWLVESNNCPLTEVLRLLFVEPYGVPTVVPSLRAVAAWLSLWIPTVREQVVAREPVTLIAHGDPKSLSLSVRERLLEVYAKLDAAGNLNAERLDFRAAWMFSSPDLGNAVRMAWQANDRSEFRMHLLEFIEEGRIKTCVGLARQTALDVDAEPWHRVAATRALTACADNKGLRDVAKLVKAAPDRLSARIAPHFAKLLFPNYLNTDELIDLMDRSEPAREFQSEGFANVLASLHAAAPNRDAQRQLASGVAALVLRAPHLDEDTEVSSRHAELGKGLPALAKSELERRTIGDVDGGLVGLLMAVERIQGFHGDQEEYAALAVRVRADKTLNRRLVWADAKVGRTGKPKETLPVNIWQVGPHTAYHPLWGTDRSDLEWLTHDARSMPEEYERRIAFSAVMSALRSTEISATEHALLEELAAADTALRADLEEFLKPTPADPYAAGREARKTKADAKTREARQSWINFRNMLAEAPETLDAPEAVKSWEGGLYRLYHLTNWIDMKARNDAVEGSAKWQLLAQGFGAPVLVHYRRAMAQAWRHIAPERPKKTGDNAYSIKHVSSLAIQALEVDSLTSGWEQALLDADVSLAMRHACLAGSIRVDWVDRLIAARPHAALPEIISAVTIEYRANGTRSDVLSTASHNDTAALPAVAAKVFRLLQRSEPVDDATLDLSIRVIRRGRGIATLPGARKLLVKRFEGHHAAGNEKRAFWYLGALASIDPDELARITLSALSRGSAESGTDHAARVQRWLGELFAGQGEHGVAVAALPSMPLAAVAKLLRLAYEHIPETDWTEPRGGSRDKPQRARSTLFYTLAERQGRLAYDTLIELSSDPLFADMALRLREVAHARAEADAELPPWLASEVAHFEHQHTAPVKTGAQLMVLIQSVLGEIQASFKQADTSSRALLALAQDEAHVQQWLTERLNERARGRYAAHREPEVADLNEPDIIVTSTSSAVQLAIEIKNGNMDWSVAKLERALKSQLAHDYLLASDRRHGILLVSLHTPRTWRVAGQTWDFARVISHLHNLARGIHSNESGPVQVSAFGLNASNT